jgi:hypothetical protein
MARCVGEEYEFQGSFDFAALRMTIGLPKANC